MLLQVEIAYAIPKAWKTTAPRGAFLSILICLVDLLFKTNGQKHAAAENIHCWFFCKWFDLTLQTVSAQVATR